MVSLPRKQQGRKRNPLKTPGFLPAQEGLVTPLGGKVTPLAKID